MRDAPSCDLFVTHTVCLIHTEIRPVVAFPFFYGNSPLPFLGIRE